MIYKKKEMQLHQADMGGLVGKKCHASWLSPALLHLGKDAYVLLCSSGYTYVNPKESMRGKKWVFGWQRGGGVLGH